MDVNFTCHYCLPYSYVEGVSAGSMLACYVPQQVGLLLELPVTVGALEARLHTTFVLDVVLEALASLVESAAAGALVGTEEV